ncbi:MAG: sugar phosphate nucleotidyltransferase, partial [Gemmatimonadaceae bacterium]
RMRKADDSARIGLDQASVADAGVKGMIPIGRPFLDFVVSALADAGFRRVCLVVGPEHGMVRHHFQKAAVPTRVDIAFAVQDVALGTANAVLAAQPIIESDSFAVLNSDNYYPATALATLRATEAPAIAGFRRRSLIGEGNIAADRIGRFGALDVDADGFLRKILVGKAAESLAQSDDALASMNCWLFDSRIFEACRLVPISVRNEYELPQAVQLGIDELGMKFRVVPLDAGVLDLSSRGDIATVSERLKSVEVRL